MAENLIQNQSPVSKFPVIIAEIANPLSATEVMPYTQAADFFLWFTPTIKQLAIITATAPIVVAIFGYTGLLQTVFFPLAVAYINCIKPFLTMQSIPALQQIIYEFSNYIYSTFAIAAVAISFATIGIMSRPNALCLTENGISYGESITTGPEKVMYKEKSFLKYADIARVDIIRPKSTKSNLDYIFAFERNLGRPIKLRFGDILTSADRARFLATIKNHFGDQIDDEKLEPFETVGDNTSYTELWLKELSAPPKRNKLTPLDIGTQLSNGRFTIIAKIGTGGQGTVYLAQDTHNGNNEVVLKEFLLPVFPDSRVRKAAAVKFQEEADLLGKLSHPQVVKFYTLFLEDHRAYLVLEKLEGKTLKDHVDTNGPVPPSVAIDLTRQMCVILKYLHEQSPPVVHRDFTPDNLILAEDGQLKLLDFSVAQSISSNVTGSVVGKPHYLAPEQFRGKATSQSDLYSFGATLYYLLTAKQPEPITNLKIDSEQKNKHGEKGDLLKLARIIEKATKLDAANRYKRADEILQELSS